MEVKGQIGTWQQCFFPSLWTARLSLWLIMSVFHDEVEIEDFEYDEDSDTYYYPCPCGDQFQISRVGS